MHINNLTSVIMPVGDNEKEQNYLRTIDSLIETAKEDIEILFLADGWEPNNSLFNKYSQVRILPSVENLGERRTVNRGAKLAKGDYIFRIDAHCKMSNEWDVKLKKSCEDNYLLVCIIDAIKEKNWLSLNHNYTFVYITPSAEEKWWGYYHKQDNNKILQETMTLTGCGWFCKKDYFNNKISFDEDLGKWGCIGPEMSAKVEKSNGHIMLHKEVFCGHLFNTNLKGYPIDVVADTRKKILQRYHKEIYQLAQKFKPVPTWENVNEDYLKNWESYFMYNVIYDTDVIKQDKTEIKDKDNNVIKKIIKKYKPVKYVGKEDPDIPEVGKKITQNAEIELIKVAEINSEGKWEFIEYNTKQEIDMYLFENE